VSAYPTTNYLHVQLWGTAMVCIGGLIRVLKFCNAATAAKHAEDLTAAFDELGEPAAHQRQRQQQLQSVRCTHNSSNSSSSNSSSVRGVSDACCALLTECAAPGEVCVQTIRLVQCMPFA
jgi:hypothetical protein